MTLRHVASNRGLTLLEMLVVLVLLVTLATVAIQSSTGLVDQGRYKAGTRTLTAAELAVVGLDGEREPDGTRRVSGFVADIGRLPVVSLDGDGDPAAGELLEKPSALTAFGLKAAPTITYTGPGPTGLVVEDDGFPIAAGWRGPYLRLPVGASVVRDGWGSKLDLLDAVGAAYGAGDVGKTIHAVRSNGSDAAVGSSTSDPYEEDTEVVFTRGSVDRVSATISGTVSVSDGAGGVSAPLSGDVVVVLLFGPDPTSGGVMATHVGGTTTGPIDGSAAIVAAPWSFSLPSTVGPRALRAYVYRTSTSTLYTGPLVRLVLVAGGQVRDLTVEVP